MNMHQMEYFVTCAALLNFQKAAKYHYTSLSTISRNISALENELGAKLFTGEIRKISLTWEGIWTFDYIMDVMNLTRKLQERLSSVSKDASSVPPCFRIASYAFDSTFSHLLNILDLYPYIKLEKQLKFDFVLAGSMINTVKEGYSHIGIETAVQLRPFRDSFDTQPLFISPFQLLVDPAHPLARQKSISVDELLRDFGTYDAFVFDDKPHIDLLGRRIGGVDELRNLGEITVNNLPRIFNKYCDTSAIKATKEIMILAPQALRDPHFRLLQPVVLKGEQIVTEYELFWKKDDRDADIPRFLELILKSGEQ